MPHQGMQRLIAAWESGSPHFILQLVAISSELDSYTRRQNLNRKRIEDYHYNQRNQNIEYSPFQNILSKLILLSKFICTILDAISEHCQDINNLHNINTDDNLEIISWNPYLKIHPLNKSKSTSFSSSL